MPEPSEASTSRAAANAALSHSHADSKTSKGGGKRRKAGGPGKKGKKFMEDKAGLLSLISSVTNSHSAKVDAKLDKIRARLPPPSGPQDEPEAAMSGSREDKDKEERKREKDRRRAEKGLALARAKDAIREKEREKKRLKKGGPASAALSKPKKRVGFA